MVTIPVAFTVTSSVGTLTAAGNNPPVTSVATSTDAQGFASVGSWVLGSGSNTVTAVATAPHPSSAIVPTAGVGFTATGYPATKLGFGVQPTITTAGTSFSVTVLVQDQSGRTVPASSASVTIALNAGNGATLLGTKTVTADHGVATLSGLSIQKAGTGYSLTATSGTLTSATSNSFNITAASVAQIAINGGNNQTAVEGSTLGTTVGTTAPSVLVTDQYGNPVGAGVGVTFTVASGAGSVGSPSATTSALGITSTTWTIVAGTNTLNAYVTALGTAGAVSFTTTGTSVTKELLSCAPSAGNGDELTRAFYWAKPGSSKTLKQVTLYLASNDPANIPTSYSIELKATDGAYNGTLIGTSTQTVQLRGSASQNLATQFTFSNVSLPSGNKNVAFQFRIVSNPNGAKLYFAKGPTSCSSITETAGVLPLPLSTKIGTGVGIKILGS
jgi:hypothetical protein